VRGNRISLTDGSGVTSYSYDSANRPRVVASADATHNFYYNGLGQQLAQSTDGTPSYFLVDLNCALPQLLSDGTETSLYGQARLFQPPYRPQKLRGWPVVVGARLPNLTEVAPGAPHSLAAQSCTLV
jgi:YD repeat-containing protein